MSMSPLHGVMCDMTMPPLQTTDASSLQKLKPLVPRTKADMPCKVTRSAFMLDGVAHEVRGLTETYEDEILLQDHFSVFGEVCMVSS